MSEQLMLQNRIRGAADAAVRWLTSGTESDAQALTTALAHLAGPLIADSPAWPRGGWIDDALHMQTSRDGAGIVLVRGLLIWATGGRTETWWVEPFGGELALDPVAGRLSRCTLHIGSKRRGLASHRYEGDRPEWPYDEGDWLINLETVLAN